MNADDILAAYGRIRRSLSAQIETAIDYGLPTLDTVEQDLRLLGAGFFLLLFGVLEQSARALASSRAANPRDKAYFRSRECKLERVITQLALAADVETQIFNMGKIRDAAAHGQRLAGAFNIQALVAHFRSIDALALRT